jgi:hypothetical protein
MEKKNKRKDQLKPDKAVDMYVNSIQAKVEMYKRYKKIEVK